MSEGWYLGQAAEILADGISLLDGIVDFLLRKLDRDASYVQDLQSLRHDLQRLDGIAIPDNGVCQMKLKLFEYVDTEIRSKLDAIKSVKEKLSGAQNYKSLQHSHRRVAEGLRNIRDAENNLKSVRSEARGHANTTGRQSFTPTANDPSPINTKHLRLPDQDLRYRRAVQALNGFRAEGRELCTDEYHDLINSGYQEYIVFVKDAIISTGNGTIRSVDSLLQSSNNLVDAAGEVSEGKATRVISAYFEKDKEHCNQPDDYYFNYFTGYQITKPFFGLNRPELMDVIRRIAVQYNQRLASPVKAAASLPPTPVTTSVPLSPITSSSQTPSPLKIPVVSIALELERDFTIEHLDSAMKTMRATDIRVLLRFVLVNLPNPLLSVEKEEARRFSKGLPRREMKPILQRQTSESASVLRYLCESYMWDEELAEAVTQIPGTMKLVVDIARKWDFTNNDTRS